ncbi:hypothetical protein HK405_002316, partial [Cladochytrium tenue]
MRRDERRRQRDDEGRRARGSRSRSRPRPQAIPPPALAISGDDRFDPLLAAAAFSGRRTPSPPRFVPPPPPGTMTLGRQGQQRARTPGPYGDPEPLMPRRPRAAAAMAGPPSASAAEALGLTSTSGKVGAYATLGRGALVPKAPRAGGDDLDSTIDRLARDVQDLMAASPLSARTAAGASGVVTLGRTRVKPSPPALTVARPTGARAVKELGSSKTMPTGLSLADLRKLAMEFETDDDGASSVSVNARPGAEQKSTSSGGATTPAQIEVRPDAVERKASAEKTESAQRTLRPARSRGIILYNADEGELPTDGSLDTGNLDPSSLLDAASAPPKAVVDALGALGGAVFKAAGAVGGAVASAVAGASVPAGLPGAAKAAEEERYGFRSPLLSPDTADGRSAIGMDYDDDDDDKYDDDKRSRIASMITAPARSPVPLDSDDDDNTKGRGLAYKGVYREGLNGSRVRDNSSSKAAVTTAVSGDARAKKEPSEFRDDASQRQQPPAPIPPPRSKRSKKRPQAVVEGARASAEQANRRSSALGRSPSVPELARDPAATRLGPTATATSTTTVRSPPRPVLRVPRVATAAEALEADIAEAAARQRALQSATLGRRGLRIGKQEAQQQHRRSRSFDQGPRVLPPAGAAPDDDDDDGVVLVRGTVDRARVVQATVPVSAALAD